MEVRRENAPKDKLSSEERAEEVRHRRRDLFVVVWETHREAEVEQDAQERERPDYKGAEERVSYRRRDGRAEGKKGGGKKGQRSLCRTSQDWKRRGGRNVPMRAIHQGCWTPGAFPD
jgi:hypothetical protein